MTNFIPFTAVTTGVTWDLYHGDCLEVLKTLPDNSVDSIVTDPPAGINFMGKDWDKDKGGRDKWVAWMSAIAQECLRVIKPGGHALVWAIPRTSHWTGWAWENADWEVRDKVIHLNCLTPDTEILINGRWVHYTLCVEGDLALCYDADHDTFTWGPIQAIYESHYKDTIFHIRGDRTDQLVTRNHRCPVEQCGNIVFLRAEDLVQEREARVPILEDVQTVLAALPLPQQNSSGSQSCLSGMRTGGDTSTSASDDETTSDLSNLQRTLHPKRWDRSCQGDVLLSQVLRSKALDENTCGQSQSSGVGSFGDGGVDIRFEGILQGKDVRIEQPCLEGRGDNLQDSRELRRGEICAVPFGVSANGPEGRICDGASFDRGSCVRSMSVTDGNGASHESHPHGQQTGESRSVQDQSGAQAVRASRFTTTDLVRVEPISYDGVVWCVKVATGAFVARRNGKVFVTGNSQGFPKGLNISKAVDELRGVEREVVGAGAGTSNTESLGAFQPTYDVTVSATDEAKQWEGWNTALKPAAEDWWLFRKPLDGTIASNVLTHGTGALNIEGSRVMTHDNLNGGAYAKDGTERYDGDENYRYKREGGAGEFIQPSGRWPANVVLSHDENCQQLGVKKVSSSNAGNKSGKGVSANCYSNYASHSLVEGYADADGKETVTDWECVEGCPVKALDAQSGVLHSGDSSVLNRAPGNGDVLSIGKGQTGHSHGPSSGGASRFFNVFSPFVYFPKVNNMTARGKGNIHPTVKNVNLMRWLVRLITPPGGTVLDPFAGSGTTGLACIAERFTSVLIEKEKPYVEIIKSRIGELTPGWLRERNEQDTENSQSDDLPRSLEDLLGLGD